MTTPVKITNKYITLKNRAVRTIQITVKDMLELQAGDTLILNAAFPERIEIKKGRILSTVYPYPDN